ncbi:hypothetical protein [Rhizobium sp. No.120]
MTALVKFDTSAFEKAARRLEASPKQMAFAISKTLNQAAHETRRTLISQTWPQHVTQRNKGFIGFALGVENSSRTNLTVKITDARAKGRGNLLLHADGGQKRTERHRVAVPIAGQRLGATGLAKSQRPAAILGAFEKNGAIFKPYGKKYPIYVYKRGKLKGKVSKAGGSWGGAGRGIKRMFVLKPSVTIKPDVPFRRDFRVSMELHLRRAGTSAMSNSLRRSMR